MFDPPCRQCWCRDDGYTCRGDGVDGAVLMVVLLTISRFILQPFPLRFASVPIPLGDLCPTPTLFLFDHRPTRLAFSFAPGPLSPLTLVLFLLPLFLFLLIHSSQRRLLRRRVAPQTKDAAHDDAVPKVPGRGQLSRGSRGPELPRHGQVLQGPHGPRGFERLPSTPGAERAPPHLTIRIGVCAANIRCRCGTCFWRDDVQAKENRDFVLFKVQQCTRENLCLFTCCIL